MKIANRINHKKNISHLAVVFVLLLVDIYLSALSKDFNLLNHLTFIENETLRVVALGGIQMVLFGSSYAIVYFVFLTAYSFWWKLKNKEYYLKGAWLHIHDKEDVKIGVVDIEQEFFDLSVNAINIAPRSIDPKKNQTTWHYIATDFHPEGSMEDRLVGCYLAHRMGERNKYGVHMFSDIPSDRFPTALKGNFGDIFKIEDKKEATGLDRTGTLYMFKMPGCIKRFIGYKNRFSFDANRLSDIIQYVNTSSETVAAAEEQKKTSFIDTVREKRVEKNKRRIKQTEFYKKLVEVLDKNDFQKQYRLICEHIAKNSVFAANKVTQSAIDDALAEILCISILADHQISSKERQIINYFFGTSWDNHYIRMIRFGIENSSVSGTEKIQKFVSKVKNIDEDLLNMFYDLVIFAINCVIHSDGIVTDKEVECQTLIKDIFV